MQVVKVNLKDEYTRVENLRRKQERLIIQQFGLFLKRSTTPEVIELFTAAAETTNLEPALTLIDKFVEQFGNVLADAYIAAGQAEADIWLPRLGLVAKAAQFNVTHRRVTEFLTTSRDNFIRNLTRQQRSAVRQSLIRGLQQGKTNEQIARSIVRSIGLTPEQESTVATYERALVSGSHAALQRELRNPRFDERVSTAIEEGEALTNKQIETMVNNYANNLKRHRAIVIATTESLKMVNRARNEAVRQAAELAGYDTAKGTKTWQTTLDGRERPSHRALDGETVSIDEPFVSPTSGARLMYPGDTSLGAPASEVVNCRCSVNYNFER